jgi:hypothetical protein
MPLNSFSAAFLLIQVMECLNKVEKNIEYNPSDLKQVAPQK